MNTQEFNPALTQAPEGSAAPAPPVPPVYAAAQPAPVYAPAPGVVRRSPGGALLLSFFPGLGHLYLGLYQRAIGIFLCFAAAIWLAEHNDLGILVAFVWFFAVIDAYRQAQAINAGGVVDPLATSLKVPTLQRGRGNIGFGVFLAVLGTVLLYNQFYPIDFTFLADWWPLLLIGAGVWMVAAQLLDRRRREAESAGDSLAP